MSSNPLIGLAIAVGGVVLLIFGLNSSNAMADPATAMLSGQSGDSAMLYWTSGIFSLVGGSLLALAHRDSSLN